MKTLPFNIKSIEVRNTGLTDKDVDGIDWIDQNRIKITNSVECVYDDGEGGTCVAKVNEFNWSFKELDIYNDAYVLITLDE